MNNKKSIMPSVVFMHIQKTAGSSLVHWARKYYGNKNIMSHGDHLNGWSEFPLIDKFFDPKIIQNKYDHIPFLSGHFGYDFVKPFLKKRYSFTFLRDPVERIISFYYFCRSRDPNQFRLYRLAQKYTFEEFLYMGLSEPEIKACIWNNQTWQLAHGYGNSNGLSISSFSEKELLNLALKHLTKFSYIGFSESFAESYKCILDSIGVPQSEVPLVVNATSNRPMLDNLPQPTLHLLQELTHLDRALYQTAWLKKEKKYV